MLLTPATRPRRLIAGREARSPTLSSMIKGIRPLIILVMSNGLLLGCGDQIHPSSEKKSGAIPGDSLVVEDQTVQFISKSDDQLLSPRQNTTTRVGRIDSTELFTELPSNSCLCPASIGSSYGEKPVATAFLTDGVAAAVCGFADHGIHNMGLVVSEFSIVDCNSNEILVEYDATQICVIDWDSTEVIIDEYQYLPSGENWGWVLLKIAQQKIVLARGELIAKPQMPRLGEIYVSEQLQRAYIASLPGRRQLNSGWEEDIGRLLVLSLADHEKPWQMLTSYREVQGQSVDRAISEQLADAIATVQWIKEN